MQSRSISELNVWAYRNEMFDSKSAAKIAHILLGLLNNVFRYPFY